MISIKLLKQLVKFGAVGVLASGVHYVVALTASTILGCSLQASNLMGFSCGFIISYVGQAFFTFGHAFSWKTLSKYLLLACFTYTLSVLIVTLLSGFLPPAGLFAVTVMLIPVFSFLISKFFVFRRT
ncbi:GtrA family protein [Marinagarivorans cellulosilyticus]|uniref:GtrA/DPMS transmembrane domain-containing protein n=1 Tax=Marinagarivorans cellulosilyticus TaxID=2721545 RepID=A0AAN1WGC5_9GAMM|nr:GtrA family protein [Marinagarivorans cellulosilyticus]BCD97063.1 hypothetical protein MARGE09_P1263 [Marinagarivorans cellulosilyticus]